MTERTLPAPRTPDPMDAPPLRWGILGPGGIARTFCDALGRGTRQQVVAVGSRDPDRARTFAADHGATAYGSYAELVADPRVDVVYVASPHSAHHEHAALAIDAGKPVLVEKAFTQNATQARDLVARARSRGTFLLEAMWSRFLPHYDVVRRSLEEGLIGDMTAVIADHGHRLYPGGPARLADPDLAGGALLDVGVYAVSFADLVLGRFASVSATGTLTATGVDAQEAIVVTGASGALGVLHSSMLAHSPTTATICGTEGRLELGEMFYAPTEVRLFDRAGKQVDRYVPTGDVLHQGLRYEAAETARCVAAGATESPLLPLDTSVRVVEAMDAVREQLGVQYPGD